MDCFLSPDYCNLYDSISHTPISLTPPSTEIYCLYSPSPAVASVTSSSEMESIKAVEKILNYNFNNKSLLKKALTHSSCMDFPSYERLEFVGDSVVGLAITKYLYLAYPNLEPRQLSLLRSANVSNEKLARVAHNHGLYQFLQRNTPTVDEQVKEFSEAVSKEDGPVAYGGLVKAPKVLADLVESVVGAVYVDVDFDLKKLWVICRGLFEPVVTLEDLQREPQPISMLYQLCQKHHKQIYIRKWKGEAGCFASVYIDDKFFGSGSAGHKDIAKQIAAREALRRLSDCIPIEMDLDEDNLEVELEGAKGKLNEICSKKKWPKPIYSFEEEGPVHGKKFVCSAKIEFTTQEPLCIKGDEQSKKKKAENSSAYLMIRALRQSNYL